MEIHPFSPQKILCYYPTWKKVYEWYNTNCKVKLPFPITVSTDLSARCNMRCRGCNAYEILSNNNTELDAKYLKRLTETLDYYGIKANCLGGGGDSTMNPHLSMFVDEMKKKNIGIGMVTNGILLDKVSSANKFDWIGVSVDAFLPETWGKIHGVKPQLLHRVWDNMENLIANDVQTTYKYLIRPENVREIYHSAHQAKEMGCFAFHARPMADPWFSEPSKRIFTNEQVEIAKSQLDAVKHELPNFAYGVLSKVGKNFEVVHQFSKCWAIYATCVFQSNKKVGLCCDLRGCPTVEVGPFEDPMEFFTDFWGSIEHRNIQNNINVDKCSRCTFSYLNKVFEEVVINDKFMVDFI